MTPTPIPQHPKNLWCRLWSFRVAKGGYPSELDFGLEIERILVIEHEKFDRPQNQKNDLGDFECPNPKAYTTKSKRFTKPVKKPHNLHQNPRKTLKPTPKPQKNPNDYTKTSEKLQSLHQNPRKTPMTTPPRSQNPEAYTMNGLVVEEHGLGVIEFDDTYANCTTPPKNVV